MATRMDSLRGALSAPFRFPRLGALIAGSIAACGFQPLSLWPLTIVALALLIELLSRTKTPRAAFVIGWCFGLGHFTIGNNWIATAFTYQAEMPAWLGGIAVVLVSLYLAIFPALAMLATWLFIRFVGPRSADEAGTRLPLAGLVFPAMWVVSEWMRAWVFTGFAWNPLGMVLLGQFDAQGLALIAPWTGTYALSGVVVGIAALLRFGLLSAVVATGPRQIGWLAGGLVGCALITVVMVAPASYLTREQGAVPFTLIQPDLRQETLNDPRLFESHFLKMARLSLPRSQGARRVVFWPESGLADYLRDGYSPFLYRQMTYAGDPELARERIGSVIGPYGLLLTGAVDLVVEDGDDVAARNSVTAIDGGGHILAGYSKAHLVPFGEYLALRWLLEPLGATRLVAGTLDFWPGPGPRSFDFGNWGKAGIQICYEIVFSGEVIDRTDRPDYIFNPSNDGWFGSWGPPQHLAQARLRAIEEGLPVLRSTTTGISAVIDADGIVRGQIRRHTAGRLDGMIPPPHEPTLFARWGNLLPLLYAALLLAASAVALRRARR